jgi:urease accessory protein
MYAVTCPSEPAAPLTFIPGRDRARGEIRASFTAIGDRTRLARLHEHDGLRLRFPRTAQGCEAVLVNTAGGVIGGDRAALSFDCGPRSDVTLTTQAAEKIYRAQSRDDDDRAVIEVTLKVSDDSRTEWLPQETILFDQANLARRLSVDLAATAHVTLLESIVFGRVAMGEHELRGSIHDRWRVRREGKLVFAEDLRLSGDITATLARPAGGGDARAIATLLHVAPDAEQKLDPIRAALEAAECESGASAWNGFVLVRLLSASPEKVRAAILILLNHLRGRDAPRVWN